MDIREIANLACKILGLYIIIQAFNIIFNFLYLAVTSSFQDQLVTLVFAIGYLIFGILLWCFSGKLASLMVKMKSNDSEQFRIDRQKMDVDCVQRVAFSVIGLFFIGDSLPKLIGMLSSIYLAISHNNPVSTLFFISAEAVAEFIIGISIFLGAQGLVNLLNKLRSAGLDTDENIK